jgi:hypothetical protein
MYIQSYTFFCKVITLVNIFLHKYSFYLIKNAQIEIFCVILHPIMQITLHIAFENMFTQNI